MCGIPHETVDPYPCPFPIRTQPNRPCHKPQVVKKNCLKIVAAANTCK